MILPMMLFTGILCVSLSQQDKVVVTLSQAQAAELRQQAEICGKEYDVDPKVIRKMLLWTFPNDKPHKQFLYCLCFNAGYINEDGHYKIDKMLEVTPVNGMLEDYIKDIENCNKITRENNWETIYEMLACFHRHYIPTVATNSHA